MRRFATQFVCRELRFSTKIIETPGISAIQHEFWIPMEFQNSPSATDFLFRSSDWTPEFRRKFVEIRFPSHARGLKGHLGRRSSGIIRRRKIGGWPRHDQNFKIFVLGGSLFSDRTTSFAYFLGFLVTVRPWESKEFKGECRSRELEFHELRCPNHGVNSNSWITMNSWCSKTLVVTGFRFPWISWRSKV